MNHPYRIVPITKNESSIPIVTRLGSESLFWIVVPSESTQLNESCHPIVSNTKNESGTGRVPLELIEPCLESLPKIESESTIATVPMFVNESYQRRVPSH